MIQIFDPLDPRVAPYSLLKAKEEKTDYFIADNEKTVVRLLESSLEVVSIFSIEKYLSKHKRLISTKISNPNSIFVADRSVFESTIGFSVHQGMMAVAKKPELNDPNLSFPIIVCNRIFDAENIGSIIRTSAAFGISSLLLDKKSSFPYLRRSVRVSMGNIFSQKIFQTDSLGSTIEGYKAKNIPVIGMSLPRNDQELARSFSLIEEFRFPERFLLVLGNEAEGIDPDILRLCDRLIYIPMKNGVDSLNVSHSLAVALAFSQRR
ncbi:TrmH family RNA methyltransferase [Leptospira idonii]|uniref:RNA methyltransferase n=1 Tax=Leptospira idonii TaxID=1193500 RepID=A0A4V3JY83_9LEPT|nr:RNA methyltransferase [Leptospira idonii]TGN20246.1 RNA methyltransferase [Leptospira idonii]